MVAGEAEGLLIELLRLQFLGLDLAIANEIASGVEAEVTFRGVLGFGPDN